MRVRGSGYWEIFVPAARSGDKYKYEIVGPDGALLPLKSDPFAFAAETRPSTASIVLDLDTLPQPRPARAGINSIDTRRFRSTKCILGRGGASLTRVTVG